MLIILLFLIQNTVGKVIVPTVPPQPENIVILTLNGTSRSTLSTDLASSLSVDPQAVVIVKYQEYTSGVVSSSIAVKDGYLGYLDTDLVIDRLHSSTLPIISLQKEVDSHEAAPVSNGTLWSNTWFVLFIAVLTGVVLFILVVPPLYWFVVKKRKRSEGELRKLDSLNPKRYDTISREGSLQSRRKLAPLTLTPFTAESDPSDNDESPPGVKESLLSHTSTLTPLQLRRSVDNPAILYAEFSNLPSNEESRFIKKTSFKNRYQGVLPNLHSRVKINGHSNEPVEGYINANYIRGYNGMPGVYIATQGPLKHTVNDFWRMIWQEKSTTIVMITKLQEKGRNKCVLYWPEKVGQYGNLSVTLRDTTPYEGFNVTSMLISDGVTVRRICHMWMWSWPDQGVPESARSLLALLSCVHSVWMCGQSPLVVHCSAGLGRTGCFIAADIGIQCLKDKQTVDVLNTVANMRMDRGGMVQTLEQYEFIHRSLLHHEMVVRNRQRYKGLRRTSFSHEGPPSDLYASNRRMSCSGASNNLDISTSLPTYITTVQPTLLTSTSCSTSDIPSPASPKPPSLLQLSKLMEKSSKRKISHLKRVSAVDVPNYGSPTEHSPPYKYQHTMDESNESPEFVKTPSSLKKSSFSLDLGMRSHQNSVSLDLGNLKERRELPRSASEDPPDQAAYLKSSSESNGLYSSMESFSNGVLTNSMPSFIFDFDIPECILSHKEDTSQPNSPLILVGGGRSP